jgi:hypothetical protein
MKRTLLVISILTVSSWVFAQEVGEAVGKPMTMFYQSAGGVGVTTSVGGFERTSGAPVQGAPYSATISNETIQTLADGNRIVHNSSGSTARDSQGRTRQETALPAIGNLSAAKAPHLVFIRDPVAQTSYTLNLTDKTAHKMPAPPAMAGGPGPKGARDTFFVHMEAGGPGAPPLPPMPSAPMIFEKHVAVDLPGQESTENLGSQTMEGVLVIGVRTTRTIPAGQIGNEKPITIVSEVWTSPELKTIVSSKRSDPRMGEQTFRLTNIVRGEPDASLFTVPADFKITDGPQPITYRPNQ